MSPVQPSRLAYGCMRIAEDREKGKRAVRAAIDAGYTLFDHADIYGDGHCETLFGEVLRESPGIRDDILINNSDQPIDVAVATGLPPGDYIDIVGGRPITVNEDSFIEQTMEPLSVVAVLEDSA